MFGGSFASYRGDIGSVVGEDCVGIVFDFSSAAF